jgi:hypothetical protein
VRRWIVLVSCALIAAAGVWVGILISSDHVSDPCPLKSGVRYATLRQAQAASKKYEACIAQAFNVGTTGVVLRPAH